MAERPQIVDLQSKASDMPDHERFERFGIKGSAEFSHDIVG
jgi:hypothetical protein